MLQFIKTYNKNCFRGFPPFFLQVLPTWDSVQFISVPNTHPKTSPEGLSSLLLLRDSYLQISSRSGEDWRGPRPSDNQ